MQNDMQQALQKLLDAISELLPGAEMTAYLYGSVPADDFRHGWSDIDLLVLTDRALTAAEAERLVMLRQELTAAEPDCPYYRACEGSILPLQAFLSGQETRAVYWGTSGQRIRTRHPLAAFEMWQLRHGSLLLRGKDVRGQFPCPGREAMTDAVRAHLRTIREHGGTGASLYTYGWMLDISRGLYTLRTNEVIAKTAAGEWALAMHLCPDEDALGMALAVRHDPGLMARQDVRERAAHLAPTVQAYADVLEKELQEAIPS